MIVVVTCRADQAGDHVHALHVVVVIRRLVLLFHLPICSVLFNVFSMILRLLIYFDSLGIVVLFRGHHPSEVHVNLGHGQRTLSP